MPSHLHLLLREVVDEGVSRYLQRLLNSYARYYNTRYHRSGPLFSGRFHAGHVPDTDLLLHVSRYIHLNPYSAGLVADPLAYQWSSLNEYIGQPTTSICRTDAILSITSASEYRQFVLDHADYARTLARIKTALLETISK